MWAVGRMVFALNDFFESVEQGNVDEASKVFEEIKQVLDKGATNANGLTFIEVAMKVKKWRMVEWLLDNDFQIEIVGEVVEIKILSELENSASLKFFACVEGGEIEKASEFYKKNKKPKYFFWKNKKEYIDKGARNAAGLTFIQVATKRKNWKMVEWLMDNGFKYKVAEKKGEGNFNIDGGGVFGYLVVSRR